MAYRYIFTTKASNIGKICFVQTNKRHLLPKEQAQMQQHPKNIGSQLKLLQHCNIFTLTRMSIINFISRHNKLCSQLKVVANTYQPRAGPIWCYFSALNPIYLPILPQFTDGNVQSSSPISWDYHTEAVQEMEGNMNNYTVFSVDRCLLVNMVSYHIRLICVW